MFFRIMPILIMIVCFFSVQAATKASKGYVQTLSTIDEYPKVIQFSATPGTPFFSLSNQYDGAPRKDPEFHTGIQNYSQKTGLKIQDNFKTAQEFYEAKKKEIINENDIYQMSDHQIESSAMLSALRVKFGFQMPELRNLLLQTGDREIIYASDDPIWGGKENRLGNMLMRVRGEIYRFINRKKIVSSQQS